MKLEIGSGHRPTPGYIHNDVNAFDGVDLVGNSWELDLPPESLDQVLALGVIEHLTYAQAQATFARVHELLEPGGVFLFDVPAIERWAQYLCCGTDEFTDEHIFATIYGWQRWPGDEHKSGWNASMLLDYLAMFPSVVTSETPEAFRERGLHRNRFDRRSDAHLYVRAVK